MISVGSVDGLEHHARASRFRVGADADRSLLVVDLDALGPELTSPERVEAALSALRDLDRTATIVVGAATHAPTAGSRTVLDALTFTLATSRATSRAEVEVPGLTAALEQVSARITRCPRAASTLREVIGVTSHLPVDAGLTVESFAYSMLLGGAEFAAWRVSRPVRPVPHPIEEPVLVERQGTRLRLILNRPRRHNAYNRSMRDALVAGLDIVELDPSVESVTLTGSGPSFCSGGDLDEFGQATDVAAAHAIRWELSAAARIALARDRIEARVHGACIGAGIELAAGAGLVVAAPDAFFELPELGMGLIPGAGGTVTVTRRVGPWRSAYLALTGARIDATTALAWGLIDAIEG